MGYTRYTRVYPIVDYGVTITYTTYAGSGRIPADKRFGAFYP